MTTSEPTLAGPGQPDFLAGFGVVEAAGGSYLAYGSAPERPSASVCLVLKDAGAHAEALIAQALAATPADGEVVLVDGGSSDWTFSLCLRAAARNPRVALYQPFRSGGDLLAEALELARAPLAFPFDPSIDLRGFAPGATPAPLETRGFSFLAELGHGCEELVAAYVDALAPTDPVTLVLVPTAGQDPAAAEERLVALITQDLGRELDAIPDILLETSSLAREQRPSLYAAVDRAVALSPRVALEAIACGVPLVAPERDALRAASPAPAAP